MNYLNFSTKAASRQERSAQWQMITRAPSAELGDDREASIRGCDLGELRLASVAMGEHRLENDRAVLADPENGLVKFLFLEEGECLVEQSGRSVSLFAGQWCAIDKTLPFRTEARGATRQLAIAIPKRRLEELRGAPRHFAMVECFLNGAGNVLHESAASAINAATVLGRRDRARLGDVLVEMLNMVWQADPQISGARTHRARRRAVLDFIERNLADPNLSISWISEALGYSKRTLHKLFAEEATTLNRLIWNRRLDHCRHALLDPSQSRRSITEIAHAWGFSDSQHFSRAFKMRFGTSPRDFRNGNLVH
ncbi:helix-turn-helix domain-containing protein [Altericroceibacterium endophyticum]|uniref:Helix-turn-helix domain-containing protein n=1 Tax=Altericroceibacterium endophyticum TaxID=1808508 RepID=A0A6I4T8J7_9SPHN|nr:helix-turn-helix domain-containing protein [Altericroceibacterium endophyticum]MXO66441.1 helix-turn-helix domain-containing protein [Altericroceibacterium endophyticum]